MKSLNDCKWGVFSISDIFSVVEKCKCSNVSNLEKNGTVPYLGATNRNNGVCDFIKSKATLISEGNCIVFICDGEGAVGYSIYKHEHFIGSTTLKIGRCDKLNKYTAQFLVTMLNQNRKRYNFGFKRNEDHLLSEKFQLPILESGEPDWEFMELYIKSIEDKLILKWTNFSDNNNEKVEDINLRDLKWKAFNVSDFFDFKKGNQNKMNSLKADGFIPLISAKKIDNGLKQFTEKNGKSIYPGHTITLNIDGDGGAGLAYYQPCDYLLDSHVSSLKAKKVMSKYTQLFVTKAIEMQKEKYGHGYSLNDKRMKNFIFMLPIDSNGQPYWDFMDSYMRNIEKKQIKNFAEFLKKQK